jgi:hypothetical protein
VADHSACKKRYAEQARVIADLMEVVSALRAEVAQLKQNSSNSSKAGQLNQMPLAPNQVGEAAVEIAREVDSITID